MGPAETKRFLDKLGMTKGVKLGMTKGVNLGMTKGVNLGMIDSGERAVGGGTKKETLKQGLLGVGTIGFEPMTSSM